MDNLITESMIDEEKKIEKLNDVELMKELNQEKIELDDQQGFLRLSKLLGKSKIYSDFLLAKLDMAGCKLPFKDHDSNTNKMSQGGQILPKKGTKVLHTFQTKFFTGGTLKNYQVEGVEWLKILYENGINGILADEMGLGKTIQCIALLAHLIENLVKGPYLIVSPLSTIPNWLREFHRFSPKLSVILYHGNQKERDSLHPKFFVVNRVTQSLPIVVTSYDVAIRDKSFLEQFFWRYLIIDEGHRIKNYNCKLFKVLKRFNSANRLLLTGTPLQNNLTELWALLNFLVPEIFDDLTVFMSWFDISELCQNMKTNPETSGYIIKDREKKFVNMLHQILAPFLLRRTKLDVDFNIPPKKEIVVYSPLSSFFQESIYKSILKLNCDDVCLALRKYSLSKYSKDSSAIKLSRKTSQSKMGEEEEKFLVEPISLFKQLNYERKIGQKVTPIANHIANNDNTEGLNETLDSFHNLKRNKHVRDSAKSINFSRLYEIENTTKLDDWEQMTHKYTRELRDHINHKVSQNLDAMDDLISHGSLPNITPTNIYMRLRKCCNHPYLIDSNFEYPIDSDMVRISGKMIILDQLLTRLLANNHKVLLFSQMTSVLDILEDYCDYRSIAYTRLDGKTPLLQRKHDIERFQRQVDNPEALTKGTNRKRLSPTPLNDSTSSDMDEDAKVYLISTRAGGLGINLSSANCVIIFDSDWNPQSDLQAQDRCHRIGQREPVIVYRLVTEGTLDQAMVDRAFAKKKLEKMVIPREKFKDTRKNLTFASTNQPYSLQEIIDLLKAQEFESIYKHNSTNLPNSSESRPKPYRKRCRNGKYKVIHQIGSLNEYGVGPLPNDLKLTEDELESLLDWKSIFPEYYAKNPEALKVLEQLHPRCYSSNPLLKGNSQLKHRNIRDQNQNKTMGNIRPIYKILSATDNPHKEI